MSHSWTTRKSTSQYLHSMQSEGSNLRRSYLVFIQNRAAHYSSDGGPPHFTARERRSLLLRRLNIQKMRSAESAEKIARLPLRKNGESKGSTIVALFHFTITLKHYFNPTLQASRLLDQRCLLMPCYRLNMRRWERREPQSPSPLKNTGQVSSLGRRNKR